MKRFAIRSNKTRSDERPPLQVRGADAALLARFGFTKIQTAPKPTRVKNLERNKREKKPASTTSPVVQQPTISHKRPVPQPPSARQSPAARQAQGQAQPEPKEQNPPRRSQLAKPYQVQNNPPGQPVDRLHGGRNRAPGFQPPKQNTPARRDPPAAETPPASRLPIGKPQENNPSGPKPGGLNSTPGNGIVSYPPAQNGLNGARLNGKDHGSPGDNGSSRERGSPEKPFSQQASRSSQGLQGSSLEPHGSSPEPHGSSPEPRVPGDRPAHEKNGANGSTPRSSLFRPGAFASMPVLRIPPKATDPVQRPPTQIPMEVYSRPDNEQRTRNIPAKNETPSNGPVPQMPRPGRTPTLDQMLKQNVNLPAQAAVLGVCEDGLPVLLDLYDPAPGALVVIGDEREAQLEMLHTAVASLVGRNSPRSVQFIVISCEPEAWQNWVREKGLDRYCLAVERAEAEPVSDWIIRLADWTEQRRLGQTSGPSVVLVMDTLSFLTTLDYDIRLNFEWMAKEGPPAQIWPLAVISTDLAKALSGRRMLRAFQTRVLGYANHPEDYVPLAGLDPQSVEEFRHPGEFSVKAGENWLHFRLPGQ